MLEKVCEPLELPSTLAQIKRLKPIFMEGRDRLDFRELARDVMEVQTRLIDELSSRLFFQISPERSRYYDTSGVNPFGADVDSAFPSAKYDISEAAKCYALQRSTACVFHLMRSLEVALTVFANQFAVPSDHTNWHNIIEGIEKAVRNMGNATSRPPDWKDQQEFYSQAASYFMVMKDAWRNYTAHARGKYTEEEAEVLITNVRSLMQKLATRLFE